MNTAERMYAQNHAQCADFISKVGKHVSVLVRGNMGVGKTSLLPMIAERLPTHVPCYADTSTMDIPDVAMYDINNSSESLNFIYNEALGLHEDKPIILMLDEFGKANPSVKLMLLRLVLERKIGNKTLHPDSIVFMTTNLDGEGVGDMLPSHACNRMTVVELAKPDHMSWIEWGINNGLNATMLGWVKDNPQVMADWRDVKEPDDNQYIFHPQAVGRTSFCTPRSLHKASHILDASSDIDEHTLTSALVGCIGSRGALDLMAFHKLASQLPSRDSIKDNPKTAIVPDNASAVCMVIYRTLTSMTKDYVTPFMTYLDRLSPEAQGMFANGVYNDNYFARKDVVTNSAFTKFMTENTHMFTADKTS